MRTKDTLKKIGSFGIDTTILATRAAKYGVHLSLGVSKCFLNGAVSLASQFSGSSFKIGLGEFLLKETEKGINTCFDQTISLQKHLKNKLR